MTGDKISCNVSCYHTYSPSQLQTNYKDWEVIKGHCHQKRIRILFQVLKPSLNLGSRLTTGCSSGSTGHSTVMPIVTRGSFTEQRFWSLWPIHSLTLVQLFVSPQTSVLIDSRADERFMDLNLVRFSCNSWFCWGYASKHEWFCYDLYQPFFTGGTLFVYSRLVVKPACMPKRKYRWFSTSRNGQLRRQVKVWKKRRIRMLNIRLNHINTTYTHATAAVRGGNYVVSIAYFVLNVSPTVTSLQTEAKDSQLDQRFITRWLTSFNAFAKPPFHFFLHAFKTVCLATLHALT